MTPPLGDGGWPDLLGRLLAGSSLSAADCRWAMAEILAGAATSAQIAAFAVALRAKGETAPEVTGLVEAMLEVCAPLPLSEQTAAKRLLDTCGTGGDRRHTVNISTMAAIVVAAAGAAVVKHGNRAATSASGSADVLEALGVPVSLSPAGVADCVERAGIGFCFAPVFHPAMRHAGGARKEIGVPTFFNVIGPLANPARPAAQLVGVADLRLAGVVAGVLAARGVDALVVRGEEGLDELSPAGPSRIWEVRDGAVTQSVLDPVDLGRERVPLAALVGGDAAANATVARALLAGESGPVREAVLLNSAAALVAADPAAESPLIERLAAAWKQAEGSIDSGAAERLLAVWIAVGTENEGR